MALLNQFGKFSLTVLLSATLVSCDSNNSDGDLNLPGGLGTLTAIIDGVSWSAVTATATRVTNVPIPTIIIAGADASGAGMGLGFPEVSETGTFSFEGRRVSDGATVSVINGAFDVGNGLSPF